MRVLVDAPPEFCRNNNRTADGDGDGDGDDDEFLSRWGFDRCNSTELTRARD